MSRDSHSESRHPGSCIRCGDDRLKAAVASGVHEYEESQLVMPQESRRASRQRATVTALRCEKRQPKGIWQAGGIISSQTSPKRRTILLCREAVHDLPGDAPTRLVMVRAGGVGELSRDTEAWPVAQPVDSPAPGGQA